MMSKNLFQRKVIIIWIFHILMMSSFTFHGTLLPLFLKGQGLPEGTVGFIIAMVSVGALLAFLTSGPALDRYDSRKFIAAGALIWVLTSLGTAFFASTPMIVIYRVVQGIGWSFFYTSTVIYSTRSVSNELRGTVIGFIEAIGAVAISVTPALAIWMIKSWDYQEAFILSSLLAALILPLCLLLPHTPQITTTNPTLLPTQELEMDLGGEALTVIKPPLRTLSRNAILPGLITASLSCAASSFISMAPLVGMTLAVSNIGVFLGLRAFGTVPTRLLSGYIYSRKGAAWAIIPGYLVSMLAFILMPLLRFESAPYALAFIFGLGMGAASPALTTWVINHVASSERGTAVNTIAFLSELSGFIGTWIFGITLQSGQLYGIYLLVAVLLSGLIGYILYIKYKPSEIPNPF